MTKQDPTWGGVFTILEVSAKLHYKCARLDHGPDAP